MKMIAGTNMNDRVILQLGDAAVQLLHQLNSHRNAKSKLQPLSTLAYDFFPYSVHVHPLQYLGIGADLTSTGSSIIILPPSSIR